MKQLTMLTEEKKSANWLLMLVFALFFAASTPVVGAVLIWPTNVFIENAEKSAAMWLENRGTTPLTYQMRVYEWSQTDGKDELNEQDMIVGSPPIMQIDPGKRQLVRLIRTDAVPAGKEMTYRVILDEIPSAKPEAAEESNGITFRMRYSVPVFVFGEGLSSLSLQGNHDKANKDNPITDNHLSWRVKNGKKQKMLEIHNSGPVHVYLGNLTFTRQGEIRTDPTGFAGYILPGATMSWPLKTIPNSGQTLLAIINGKQLIRINAAHAKDAD